jgi:hypothetical protein
VDRARVAEREDEIRRLRMESESLKEQALLTYPWVIFGQVGLVGGRPG